MKAVIVGGGAVGYYLALSLMEHQHEPVIIECQQEVCEKLANQLDIPVVCGDGTTVRALEEADCGKADAFIAVSGRDEVNFVACQLARVRFHVPKTVAKANNPKNADVMRTLGVDMAVSSVDTLTRLLEREIDTAAIRQLVTLNHGEASISELLLPDDFRYSGKMLKDIKLPENSVIVSVERGGEMVIPRGNTLIFSGDKLLILTKDEALHEVKERLKI